MPRTSSWTPSGAWPWAVLACLAALMAGPVLARSDGGWLELDHWRHWVQTQDFGGRSRDFRTEDQRAETGPTDLGRRLKAGGLSLLLPGAGQFYNDQRGKALVMVGVEAAIWGATLGFHRHAKSLAQDYRNWAGVFAGTVGEHPDSYWQAVGRYMDSDAWHESRLRQARAFGEPYPLPPGPDQQWQWRSQDQRIQFQQLRADANLAYDRRNKMVLFALLSRAVSVYDAVRNGGRPAAPEQGHTVVSALGMDLALEVAPAFQQPWVRAMVGRSF